MQADLVTPRALVNTGSRMDDPIVDWNQSHRFLIPSCPYVRTNRQQAGETTHSRRERWHGSDELPVCSHAHDSSSERDGPEDDARPRAARAKLGGGDRSQRRTS